MPNMCAHSRGEVSSRETLAVKTCPRSEQGVEFVRTITCTECISALNAAVLLTGLLPLLMVALVELPKRSLEWLLEQIAVISSRFVTHLPHSSSSSNKFEFADDLFITFVETKCW